MDGDFSGSAESSLLDLANVPVATEGPPEPPLAAGPAGLRTGRPRARHRGAIRWAARTSWCWPALVTACLGLFQVSRPELWRDELAGWSFATRSVHGLLATARNTGGAQLPYYLILHSWIAAFGSSVTAMRALSVLAMAGAAAFVALAARELAGTRAGVAAGLVFAVIPSISRFAQEVRFYALAMCFAALATWLLARALDRPSWARWAGYTASMAAVGYLDTVAMSLLAGHAVWTALRWWRERDTRLLRFILAMAVSASTCAPVILLGSRQAASQLDWVPRPSLGWSALAQFGGNLFFSGPVAVAVLVLAALAWMTRKRDVAMYLTAAAICPLAAVWLVSCGSVSYFFPRYVLFTLIAIAILAGVAVARLRPLPAVAVIALVAVLGVYDQAMIRKPDAHNWAEYPASVGAAAFEYAAAARVVGTDAGPGDGIVYPGNGTQWEDVDLGLSYYLGQYLRHGVAAPAVLFTARTAAQADGLYSVPCSRPARCLGAHARVWLVGGSPAWDPLSLVSPAEAAVLRHDYSVRRVWLTGGMTVALLTRRAAPLIPAKATSR